MIKTELLVNGTGAPLGIEGSPVFSWRGDFSFIQKGYRIVIYNGEQAVFDTGRVESAESQWIRTGFEPESRTKYRFGVTLYDENGEEHNLGDSYFETALSERDWNARWIGAGKHYRPNWAMYYRKNFTVREGLISARLYFSGLGAGAPYLNGRRVGDRKLDPAQSEYTERVYYSVYDITPYLVSGVNCFGAELGDGWYSQNQLMEGDGVYGLPCLRAQIEITYADGTVQTVISDETFRCQYSPTVYNNMYIGETYDARLEIPDWSDAGCDDSCWFLCSLDSGPKGKMVCQFAQPIRVCREIPARAITYPQEGVAVYDFGENLAGVIRLKMRGQPANRVTVRFAENLDENGNLDYSSSGVFHIRGVQTLTYVFGNESVPGDLTITNGLFVYSGGKEAVWEPEFCYFGFRYAEVTGAVVLPDESMLTALKIHTDMPDKAAFNCDMPILNEMEMLLRRTMPNNAQGIPTDCPAREKCGWLGDANVICDSALIMWDGHDFWEKYIYDMSDCRRAYGQYFNIAPGRRHCLDTVPAWGCAMIIIPYRIYRETGDYHVLERHFTEMEAYGQYLLEHSDGGIYEAHIYQLADWAAPYGYKSTQHFFQVSAMYMYQSFRMLEETYTVLGMADKADFWRDKAENEKKVIPVKYYDFENHTYGTQTLNAFGSSLGLIPEGEEKACADWTERDIIAHDFHITCGHLGIRHIYQYLDRYGRTDTLCRVLNSRTYPSFGAQLDAGATTLWETFELSPRNQSLDHPFRGCYCAWIYEDVLGIKKLEPGYKSFEISPKCTVSGKVSGYIDTPYGHIEVECVSGESLSFTVPWNTTCFVTLPGETEAVQYGPGKYKI